MSVSLYDARKQFPALERYTYLVANGGTPLPLSSAEAAHGMIDALSNDGVIPVAFSGEFVAEVRQGVASFIGADTNEVAFSRNTAEGVNWFAQSLDWKAGDEVLMVEGEYPNLFYPFNAWADKGVKVVFSPTQNRLIDLDALQESITENTRVLAISWPQFDTGQRCDLMAIGEMCRARGILFFVDAVQGLGSFPLHVKDMKIDCLTAGTQKALLGLPGCGIFYCSQELLDEIPARNTGWCGLQTATGEEPEMDYDIDLYSLTPSSAARRFEEGCRNLVGIAALGASLQLIKEIGLANIYAQIKVISEYLCSQAKLKNCEVMSPRNADEWSGIVLLKLPVQCPKTLSLALREHGILTHHVLGYLQVGINFYNNQEDIDRLMLHIKPE